jgi:precorrin-6B methylase 2
MLLRTFLTCLALLSSTTTFAQTPKTDPLYEERKVHDPNGIGKFFKGREIAHVMGYQAAGWLERPEREKEENTTKLIESLKLKPHMIVADVGAGSGYLSFRMAPLLPKGKVLAVDIQKEMIKIINAKSKQKTLQNVETILSTEKDPKLPENSVDMIIMVDVYHEFAFPFEMTQAMCKSLRKGGTMVFVEFRGEDPEVPIKLVHKMAEKQVILEMKGHDLKHKETIGVLPWQHIIIFEKTDSQTTDTK